MPSSDNSRYELYYFDGPGRGEVTRFLLEYGKANWSERHPSAWAEEKASTPFGCLPVLIEHLEDGSEFHLGESHAIERYLARKFGLLGSNAREAALIDSFAEEWASLINALVQYRFGKNDTLKEAGKENIKTSSEAILKYHEKQLAKNGNGYYVGSKLSLVDLIAYNMTLAVKNFGQDLFSNAPGLNKLVKTVEDHPVIGPYARQRISANTPM
ncbi:glutathione S-transferase [Basidiobolus meristosporus CBS 931.73]|uniref:Glutathione S-transferase n=1 Tax=Basidiobolus meristosporus CBS 931.73 TaxID=1314790 RepID=A0A1Y1YBT2_9FUNG|nr:glutathione S-transferase [Basidiobolus meristosporus CBS 931.73]|eukprot:ORX95480.1 glutathione S-transferase [Basidiobolus meristosporus CBS 931.73]